MTTQPSILKERGPISREIAVQMLRQLANEIERTHGIMITKAETTLYDSLRQGTFAIQWKWDL